MNRLESQLNGDFYRDELINTTKINFRETQRLTAKVDEYEFSLGMVYWHLKTKYGRGGVQIGFGNYIIGIEGDQKWERELFEMEQDLEIKTKATGYTYSLGVLWQKQFIRNSSVSIPIEFGIICSQSKGHSDIDNGYTNWSSKNTNINTFINIGLAFGSD
jgi:hypothetical protein